MGSFLKPETKAQDDIQQDREWIPALPPISDADREALKHVSPAPPRTKEPIIPPKELVELQHVPTPVPPARVIKHKISTGSVRDRIKGFEVIKEDAKKDEERRRALAAKGEMALVRRIGSNGSLSNRSVDGFSTEESSFDSERSRSYTR